MQELNGNDFMGMLITGAYHLKNNADRINDLNVFPVPDGDTGSNMTATMLSGIKEIRGMEKATISEIAQRFSKGLLYGARGNSGVILSQFFAGLTRGKHNIKSVNLDFINEALNRGKVSAYSAVLIPVEGTILTVIKDASNAVSRSFPSIHSMEELSKIYLNAANESLSHTPDLLPVLKEAGVVDSGASGLVEIIDGMDAYLHEEKHSIDELFEMSDKSQVKGAIDFDYYQLNQYGYCTEFIAKLNPNIEFDKDDFTRKLETYGTSIVVVNSGDVLKCHIHTKTPGEVFTFAQKYGALCAVKADNIAIQTEENSSIAADKVKKEKITAEEVMERQPNGIVAVVNGEGLKEVFSDLGANVIIDGGQTMNPSTQDFVDAISKVNADHIYVIPNNKNVFLSAKAAKALVNDKHVIVVSAMTIPQGYASLIAFDATETPEENVTDMEEKISKIESGEITYAIRDSVSSGVVIKKGDFISILDGSIISAYRLREEAAKDLISSMIKGNSTSMTVFYGADFDEREINDLKDYISGNFGIEFSFIPGGQAVYNYIIEVE